MHSLLYEHSTQPYLHEFGHHARVIKLVLSKDLDVERTDPDWGLVPETIKFRDAPRTVKSPTHNNRGTSTCIPLPMVKSMVTFFLGGEY